MEAFSLRKSFGAVKALGGADLTIKAGEVLGLAGHNGAGKSTLMNVVAGNVRPDGGRFRIDGQDVDGSALAANARRFGIRMVFQELSLCENLSIAENFMMRHPPTRFGWRAETRRKARAALHDIFPREPLDLDRKVATFSIAHRQMIEIACAAAVTNEEQLRLLVLDEPTSSLDAQGVAQLSAWLRQVHTRQLAVIFITHRLAELVANADRIMVMRDGKVVSDEINDGLAPHDLVARMGQVGPANVASADTSAARTTSAARITINRYSDDHLRAVDAVFREGEIVGLGGLAEHGQRELLHAVYRAALRRSTSGPIRVQLKTAFVSGDRGREGVFPDWSTGLNIAIGSLRRLAPWFWLNTSAERLTARTWLRDLGIAAPSTETPITALSGGSQQKAIMARALASGASVILFDDPTRGVDVMTKREFYDLVRREVQAGRTFVLYSTENEELLQCDRVLVLSAGRIVAELAGTALTEAALVRASFADAA